MPLFDGLHIHGVTLSLLLHSAAVSQHDCDGILFGQVTKKVRSEFRDDEDAGVVLVEELHAYVTSFICSATTATFYDAKGQISESQLAALQGSDRDPMIGWFTVRPSASLPAQPSMRESAVTASLQQLLDRQRGSGATSQPVLLAILNQKEDHHGATISMSYRLFQHMSATSPGGRPHMLPTDLHTLSLARPATGGAAPPAQMAGDAIMTDRACGGCGVSHSPTRPPQAGGVSSAVNTDANAANMVLSSTAAASMQQVLQLEEFHQSQLRMLQSVCRLVSEQSSKLAALQQEGDMLAQQLADLDKPLAV